MEVGRRWPTDRRQHTYLSVDIKGLLLGCTDSETAGKGKAQEWARWMRSQQTRNLTTSIKRCILLNVIASKLESYAGEAWEGNLKFVKQLETAQMTAAKDSRMLKYVE